MTQCCVKSLTLTCYKLTEFYHCYVISCIFAVIFPQSCRWPRPYSIASVVLDTTVKTRRKYQMRLWKIFKLCYGYFSSVITLFYFLHYSAFHVPAAMCTAWNCVGIASSLDSVLSFRSDSQFIFTLSTSGTRKFYALLLCYNYVNVICYDYRR